MSAAWDSGGQEEGGSYATQGQLMAMQGRLATVERQLQTAFGQISNLPTGPSKLEVTTAVEETVHATIDDAVEAKMAAHCQNTNGLMSALNGAMAKRITKTEQEMLDQSMQTGFVLNCML